MGRPLDPARRYAMTEVVTYNKEMVMAEWVDFNELKQRVSITDVLNHYGLLDNLSPRKGGEELVGLCPFHEERRKSFAANTLKNNFQCFSCKAQGNVLDFVRHKEQLGDGPGATREAGLLLQHWFPSVTEHASPRSERPVVGRKELGALPEPFPVVNPPLTFELKGLVATHPYLIQERGLKQETIEYFGLGYSNRGLMKGWIAIPIHDENGKLVAYAGRWPGEPPEGEDKYRFPPGFKKSLVVFNLYEARQLAREKAEIILVEGFFDAVRFWEAGIHNVASIMGTSLSDRQAELLVETLGPQGKLVVCFDNDDAGRTGSVQVFETLSSQLFIRSLRLPREGTQPDELSDKEIHQLLSGW